MASPSKSASSDPVPPSDPAPSVAAPTPSGPAPAGPPPARAAAIEAWTGTTFERWVEILDAAGARTMEHRAIARRLGDEHGVEPWWAQGVTVAYEQRIGRRVEGQSCAGTFTANISRTLPGAPEEVLERWEAFIAPRLAGLGLENPRTSRTERWLYWRAGGIDGTRVAGTLQVKGDDRTVLAIGHEKLADADDRAARKAAWTQTMKEFTAP
ncbi:hypothetical protein [Brachybacterium nesterenkovii]|uniref:hypothetical protein n=1 Tax=Brachybacterium nesterenkovii TaxID=47847 RepID=UPI001F2C4DFB|nr:hypothetical protein [Brachybacterium nesterenkovii]